MSRVINENRKVEEHELDVELDVVEQPRQSNFPRRPNVVSHRGHQLRINVTITDIPRERRFVTLSAIVYTYKQERMGEQGHVSRERHLWGLTLPRTYEIEPPTDENLPLNFYIIVSESVEDEHLGQGPYDAFVGVNTSTEPLSLDEPGEPREGNASTAENLRTQEPFPDNASIFRIEFTSM